MKKPSNKQAKKASKLAKAENLKKKANKIITVKNAEGAPDTTAEIVIQNKIDYEPKVSIIIPVYNVEQYLRECLDSVVNQTLKEIEIICVDDGSTDSSLEILKEYAKKDNRITVMKQENLHAGVARNAGLAVAKGEYVAFMDADDLYPSIETLLKMNKMAVENKALICGGGVKQLKDGELIFPNEKEFNFDKEGFISFYDYQFIYGYWRFIFHNKFLKDNKLNFPNYKRFEDPIFILKAMHVAKCFYALDTDTYIYRIIKKSKQLFDECYIDLALGIKEVLTYSKNNNLEKVYEKIYDKLASLDFVFKSKKINNEDIYNFIGYKTLVDCQLENMENILETKLLISRFRDREYFKYIANNVNLVEDFEHKINTPDFTFIHGCGTWFPQPETVKYAMDNNIPLIRMEDGFLRSADTWCNNSVDKKYTTGISFTFTNDVFYFDATQSSFMERQINNPNFKLTKEQHKRARDCIKKIVDNHLTKYNHQPIVTPNIGRNGVKKILVVDQSYGDFSIQKGLANDDTFKEMLASAIRENPDADIIIKTHPDAIAPGTKRPLGYYSTLHDHDNIYVIREPINPIALLKYVDKVYVCTTQFGFEALMCGKEVHTFGMPFYAGWGLTIDAQKCKRRTAKRTLEEIFYISYIKNTLYVDPVNKQRCSIERAIDYLIELRAEYDAYKRGEIDINNIKVSLIIPIYNVEKYLKECLNSAINQTLRDIEIICINDGSPDNSLKILKSYANKDSRIKIINQKNQGLSCSRNNAMKIAKGEYLVFLDSDDYLRKDALELIYTQMKKNNLDMLSYSGYNFNDGSNEKEINPYWEYSYIPENFNLDKFNYKDCLNFIHQLNVSACTTAYRRWFIESNNIYFPENLLFEDNIFYVKSITQATNCGIIKEKLYYRRIHKNSITQNWGNHYIDYLKITDLLLKYMKNFDNSVYSLYEKSYLMRCIWIYNSFDDNKKIETKKNLEELLCKYNFKSDKVKWGIQEENKTIVSKKYLLKSYLLLPYYLLKIRSMKRKLGKLPSSRLFLITKYGNKKVYHILGLKFAFNNFKKDVLDNQEKILKMLSDIQTRQKKLEKEINELKNN